MHEYSFLIGVAVTLMVALLSPGPSFLFVARTAVADSRSNGLAVALGLATGSAIFAIIASLGLYVVLETVPWLYVFLKTVGGLYLCYIAYKIWINARTPLLNKGESISHQPSLQKSFLSGLFVQLSNPKTAIVFASIFAAFLPSVIPEYAYVFLAAISFTLAGGWYGVVAVLLSAERPRRVYASFKHIIDRIAGGVMAALGIKLVSNH